MKILGVTIRNLRRVEDTTFDLRIEGVYVSCDIEDLISQPRFINLCFKATGVRPKWVKRKEWEAIVKEIFRKERQWQLQTW